MFKKMYHYLRRIKYKFTEGKYIGNDVKRSNIEMMPFASIGPHSVVQNTSIGRYTSIGRNATINNTTIGSFCSISWNVTIGATSHPLTFLSAHSFPYISRFQFVDKDKRIIKNTKIGSDVWIGANVVILSNICVGNGAVIGAGSVVTKDVKPYMIVAGVPAKVIKPRFSKKLIGLIEKSKWWEWKQKKIKDNINIFQSEDFEEKLLLVIDKNIKNEK